MWHNQTKMQLKYFYVDDQRTIKLFEHLNMPWLKKEVPFTLTCSPGSRAQQLGPRHVGWHALLSPQVLLHSSPHVTAHLEGCRGSTFSMWTLILWPSSFRQTTATQRRMCRKLKSKLKLWSMAPLKWAFGGKKDSCQQPAGVKAVTLTSMWPMCVGVDLGPRFVDHIGARGL